MFCFANFLFNREDMLWNLRVFIQGVPNKLLPNVWLNNSVFKEVRYSYLYSAVIMGHSGYIGIPTR